MSQVLIEMNGEKQAIEIKRIKVKQLKKVLKQIKKLLNLLKSDDRYGEIAGYFNVASAGQGGKTEEELDKEFMAKLAPLADLLLEEFPDEAIETLSVLSGIEVEVLDEQELEVMFDVFQLVVEENDLPKLWRRAKEAFTQAKSKWTVKAVV